MSERIPVGSNAHRTWTPRVGEPVQVLSVSMQAWCPARINSIDRDGKIADIAYDDGRSKQVLLNDTDVIRPLAADRGLFPQQPRQPGQTVAQAQENMPQE
eukprot:SAG11_NODE_21996_length_414_cov_0.990476_1_plen_99_part_10